MNKAILCVAMMTLTSGNLRAGDADPPRVTVYGTATTQVTPDRMEWRLTVRNQGKDIKDVAKQHTEIVANVLSFLKGKGVAEDELQTARMEFGENWEYKNNSRVKEGYFASTDVSFKIDDFGKYTDIWMGLANIDDVSIDGVYYDHSKRIEHQDKTRTEALIVAKKKAEAMAATLGARIGEPLLIEDDMSYQNYAVASRYSNVNYFDSAGGESEEPLGVSPGQIPIKMRVKVEFRLIAPME